MTSVISCAQYDYFEIACMHHYEIELTLKNGHILRGIAHNVKIIRDGSIRKEVLELRLETNEIKLIELIEVNKMQALKPNPHFSYISLV